MGPPEIEKLYTEFIFLQNWNIFFNLELKIKFNDWWMRHILKYQDRCVDNYLPAETLLSFLWAILAFSLLMLARILKLRTINIENGMTPVIYEDEITVDWDFVNLPDLWETPRTKTDKLYKSCRIWARLVWSYNWKKTIINILF